MKAVFTISIFCFWGFAYAQAQGPYNTGGNNSTSTYDVQYQSPDSGRSRVDSVLGGQINALSNEPAVLNLRIPILLGVKVSDLGDTWGDARANGRVHEGIDILAPRGTFIVSPTDAIVTTVENSGLGGNHVFTANPGGERYYYAHLDSFAQGLAIGQTLKAGDLIGYVGNTGNAAGGPTHLHFGIYEDNGPGESTTGTGAINPFPRLTLEFSLQDKMSAVLKILQASADPLTLARSLASQYQSTFLLAQSSGIGIPDIITQVLGEKKVQALGISRTLQLGSHGDDVKWLQGALGILADGNFGPKTKVAVIAFQKNNSLVADGVFGPKSRALLAVSSTADIARPAGCTVGAAYSATTGIKCL